MKILVTGGCGFLGKNLVEALFAQGHQITVLDNLQTGTNVPLCGSGFRNDGPIRMVKGDVQAPESWSGWVHGGDFDRIYHLACPASPRHYQATPIDTIRTAFMGTDAVLQLAEIHGARVLIASTSEVYGDPLIEKQHEGYWGNVNPYGPRAMYDEGKRAAEALAWSWEKERDADVRIARIFNTYGPGMARNDGRMIPEFILAGLRGDPIPIQGSGIQRRSLTYVDDLIRGLIALMESDVRGPVNIGGAVEMSVREIADEVWLACGQEFPRLVKRLPGAEDDPQRRWPDTTRARDLLGWAPKTSVQEGLKRTVEWFRSREASASPSSPSGRPGEAR